jgi:hypothetical protein
LKNVRWITAAFCVFLCWGVGASSARAGREAVTVPVILADYYVFAYVQAFKDRSFGYAYPTAAVDALGWGLVAAGKYPGLVCVNAAGLAKTVYPAVILCGKSDRDVKRRAWISIGTHAGTLLWLKAWGAPALRLESFYRPPDGAVLKLAWLY